MPQSCSLTPPEWVLLNTSGTSHRTCSLVSWLLPHPVKHPHCFHITPVPPQQRLSLVLYVTGVRAWGKPEDLHWDKVKCLDHCPSPEAPVGSCWLLQPWNSLCVGMLQHHPPAPSPSASEPPQRPELHGVDLKLPVKAGSMKSKQCWCKCWLSVLSGRYLGCKAIIKHLTWHIIV